MAMPEPLDVAQLVILLRAAREEAKDFRTAVAVLEQEVWLLRGELGVAQALIAQLRRELAARPLEPRQKLPM